MSIDLTNGKIQSAWFSFGVYNKMDRKYSVAVVGATGNTGHKVLEILAEREFPIKEIVAIASERSVGKFVSFGEKTIPIRTIDSVDFSNIDICFMCAGGQISKTHAIKIAKQGCTIIDKTSAFRMDESVPLIVPEVNLSDLQNGAPNGIISNPNCVAIPLAVALAPLQRLAKIKKLVISTYQSVSGAGKAAIETLYQETKAILLGTSLQRKSVFSKSIANNVIPLIGNVLEDGSSDEEDKIANEIRKILNIDIEIAVTSVRVPVYIGHGISVYCEFDREVWKEQAENIWSRHDEVMLMNSGEKIITPVEAQGDNSIYICRVRGNPPSMTSLLFWVVADNLRKGAALNGVQIAENLIRLDSSLKSFKYKRGKL